MAKPYEPREAAEAIAQPLLEAGLLVASTRFDGVWDVTAQGAKWIEMILETPIPVQKWVDPRG